MSGHLPNVGRPKGGVWRRLQDEGIVWEGQILITGEETDLAALLIVTNERLAFVRGGVIALDIERDWLEPAPILRRTGTVQLWISPPDDPVAESLTFIARDGRDEAAILLSMIGDRGAYGSAYRMPAYIPEDVPPEPRFPVARSRSNMPRDDYYDHGPEPSRAFYSMLDDDDFPPVEAETDAMPPWEEAIAVALEPTSVIPIAGTLRQPNDPLRPIDGFDSKFARDRRSWVIRLVGLFLLVGIGSVIASGILPGPDDVRDLFNDEPTKVTVAQIDSATSTPTEAPEETVVAEPTTEPTSAGPSSSAPRDPTVVPIETAVSLGVGGDNSHVPPAPTKEPTDTVAQSASDDGVQSSQDAPAENILTEETAVIPAADEPEPSPTATAEPTEEPVEEPTQEPTATTEPPVEDEPETAESTEPPVSEGVLMDGLELEIDEVHRGERLPDLTLGRNSIGEWVVVLVQVSNVSSEPAELAMDDIRLAPTDDLASEVGLDSASSAVASYLGMNPTVRADASAIISPGGVQPLALVFSIPVGLGDLVLLTGDQSHPLQQGAIAGVESTAGFWGATALVFEQPSSLLATDLVAESSGWPARSATGSGLAGWLSGESVAAETSGESEWSSKAARERFHEERNALHV